MRKLIITSLIAVVAAAALRMHWSLQPTDASADAVPAPARASDLLRPVVQVSPPEVAASEVVAEDRGERLVQDIERALRSFDEQERESIFTDMLPELIARDPAAAGRLVERLDAGLARDRLREHVAQKWAEHDLDGAIGWAASLESDDERSRAAADIAAQAARADPAAAIEVADQFGIGRNDGSLEQLAQMWAETNLEEALAWAQSQPRGPARDQILARIALVQASRDPVRAAELVAAEMDAGAAQREAALSVLREWASRDADAAAAWAARFPDGMVREQARAELTRAARLRQ